jgi:hypothetical protein
MVSGIVVSFSIEEKRKISKYMFQTLEVTFQYIVNHCDLQEYSMDFTMISRSVFFKILSILIEDEFLGVPMKMAEFFVIFEFFLFLIPP